MSESSVPEFLTIYYLYHICQALLLISYQAHDSVAFECRLKLCNDIRIEKFLVDNNFGSIRLRALAPEMVVTLFESLIARYGRIFQLRHVPWIAQHLKKHLQILEEKDSAGIFSVPINFLIEHLKSRICELGVGVSRLCLVIGTAERVEPSLAHIWFRKSVSFLEFSIIQLSCIGFIDPCEPPASSDYKSAIAVGPLTYLLSSLTADHLDFVSLINPSCGTSLIAGFISYEVLVKMASILTFAKRIKMERKSCKASQTMLAGLRLSDSKSIVQTVLDATLSTSRRMVQNHLHLCDQCFEHVLNAYEDNRRRQSALLVIRNGSDKQYIVTTVPCRHNT